MTATVAIMGRPNVGKSTLFNRLVGRKIALVDDQPGVTRDRREGEANLGGLRFRVFDTAGLDDIRGDSLEARMSAQAETAVDDSDVVLFVYDARAGVTPVDREFAGRVRRRGKPVILVANKAEGRGHEGALLEAFELGFGEPLAISAEHGEGLDQLYDALLPFTEQKEGGAREGEDRGDGPLRLAIIGQPNAGKSTLVNTILGEDRMLTGPEAGITRDAISSEFDWRGQRIKLWDTAGIRRKSRVVGKIEKLAVSDALRAIRFAECVVVLIDASLPVERQDLSLCDLVAREGRAAVLALSKWDLVEEKQKKLKDVISTLEDVLPEIRGVAVVTLSSKREKGIDKLLETVMKAMERWNRRIPTSQVNRWLESAIERNPPPAPSGRRIKIRYATQASARPPTFAIFGNQLSKMPESYVRYLMNGLRESFDLGGTPIRFSLRGGKNPFDKDR
ncbi:ribosome biogenesis GTPase Der [Aestuariivirga sp.]|uniref:ribosome biogenesis GTPase Der n=1 Tax=Aestuariivirga sp. TaxID=2650926 RepID=UPI0025B82AEF|nr:ribosome biogenesis GTPase Der [Aestuariivirga sp.]MCA3554611.1 ribosome biogenesis GTPase Der [Aestuariivirga sp.]